MQISFRFSIENFSSFFFGNFSRNWCKDSRTLMQGLIEGLKKMLESFSRVFFRASSKDFIENVSRYFNCFPWVFGECLLEPLHEVHHEFLLRRFFQKKSLGKYFSVYLEIFSRNFQWNQSDEEGWIGKRIFIRCFIEISLETFLANDFRCFLKESLQGLH